MLESLNERTVHPWLFQAWYIILKSSKVAWLILGGYYLLKPCAIVMWSLIHFMSHLPSNWHLGAMQTCWHKWVNIQQWNIKHLMIYLFRNSIVFWDASCSIPCVMNVNMVWRSQTLTSFTDEMGTCTPHLPDSWFFIFYCTQFTSQE